MFFRTRFLSHFASGLLLLAFSQCRPAVEPYQTERFDLTAGPAAAEGYPMEIEEGRFTTSDGKSIPFAAEFLEGDWGLSHSGVVSGDGTAPAPDSLEVRWFSYTEDKFYQGRWPMPQKRIHTLLKEGYWNNNDNKHETYTDLTMCLLPKGVAVVWLTGRNQVLLGRYQGQEVAFDFQQFNPAANRARMIAQEQAKLPAAVQARIRAGTLGTQPWDAYLKTYPWRLQFSQPLTLYNYGIFYFNAEMTQYPLTQDTRLQTKNLLEPSAKPVPNSMLLFVEAGYGRKRQIQVKAFDEAETLAAFQALRAAHPAAPLTLSVETDERVRQARVFVQSEQQRIELRKSPAAVYDAD